MKIRVSPTQIMERTQCASGFPIYSYRGIALIHSKNHPSNRRLAKYVTLNPGGSDVAYWGRLRDAATWIDESTNIPVNQAVQQRPEWLYGFGQRRFFRKLRLPKLLTIAEPNWSIDHMFLTATKLTDLVSEFQRKGACIEFVGVYTLDVSLQKSRLRLVPWNYAVINGYDTRMDIDQS